MDNSESAECASDLEAGGSANAVTTAATASAYRPITANGDHAEILPSAVRSSPSSSSASASSDGRGVSVSVLVTRSSHGPHEPSGSAAVSAASPPPDARETRGSPHGHEDTLQTALLAAHPDSTLSPRVMFRFPRALLLCHATAHDMT